MLLSQIRVLYAPIRSRDGVSEYSEIKVACEDRSKPKHIVWKEVLGTRTERTMLGKSNIDLNY